MNPAFQNDRVTMYHADSLQLLPTLAENSIDACVTDPPYELGFMGKGWDASGIAYNPALWRGAFAALKPGAHLVAFGGTRTYHRMACAIEDAGFQIRDQLAWVYGSGFPKSSNQSGEWEGWGTALKPAWEPIVLARKPFSGTVPQNLETHGTGALNIGECRIGTEVRYAAFNSLSPCHGNQLGAPGTAEARRGTQSEAKKYNGRWPANIMHDGSPEVVEQFPAEAGAAAPVTKRNGDKFRSVFGDFGGNRDEEGSTFQGDSGSAARFFYCAKASAEDREAR